MVVKDYSFTLDTLSNKRGRYLETPNAVARYSFEVNHIKKAVRVIGGKDVWNFQLIHGRFVRNGGNNHTPEGVKSMLEQMAQWIEHP